MLEATQGDEGPDNSRIVLGLLSSVERDGGQSQRRLGSELGIALGLVNAYLKRCVKKGLIKVGHAPARRYVYYLTPQGFAEKSRLTAEYLSSSFSFFRRAKSDCDLALKAGAERGFTRIALAGSSDLAEIAMICAPENGIKVTAVVDGASKRTHFVGVPVVASFDRIAGEFDAVLVTDMLATATTLEQVVALIGGERVFVPKLLLELHHRRAAKDEQAKGGSIVITPETSWHVAQTHIHAEAKAQMHLHRQGFETYLPRYLKRRRHARRTETVAAPLYPSYLFVGFSAGIHRWRSVHSTVGVARLVCNGDVPAAIDGSIISGLRKREDAQGFIQLQRRPQFTSGDKVRVREGVFCDCLGLFESMGDRERVIILLDLLGRKVRVVLDENYVAAA